MEARKTKFKQYIYIYIICSNILKAVCYGFYGRQNFCLSIAYDNVFFRVIVFNINITLTIINLLPNKKR